MPSFPGVSDAPAYWALLGVQSGKLAFDVGANGGTVSRMFAQNFDQVVAFEPGDSFQDLLVDLPLNVICTNVAVSDHFGTVRLRQAANSMRSGQLVSEGLDWGPTIGWVDVHCITLDDAAKRYGQPDLVKIDVEGHELKVLQGATVVLATKPKLMIEVHSLKYAKPIWDLLRDAGYRKPRIVRHEGYAENSVASLNHFYLVCN